MHGLFHWSSSVVLGCDKLAIYFSSTEKVDPRRLIIDGMLTFWEGICLLDYSPVDGCHKNILQLKLTLPDCWVRTWVSIIEGSTVGICAAALGQQRMGWDRFLEWLTCGYANCITIIGYVDRPKYYKRRTPRKTNMEHQNWKKSFLLKGVIFRFHVSFRGSSHLFE